MVSRQLAFVLLAVACVAAAGGGAYLATLHNVRPDSASATSSAPMESPIAPPIASAPPQATIPEADASTGKSGSVPSTPVQPSQPSAAKKPSPRASDSQASAAEIPTPVSRPAEPAPASQASAQAAALPPVTVPEAAGAVQRPWPGPPAAGSAQPPAAAGGESSRPDADAVVHDNVKLWEELVVPSESVLGLQLESSLNTENAQVEDRVDARVTRDVRVNGRVAIPSGSHVVGSVVLVERGGRVKDRARIGIRFNSLTLADGTRLQIVTDTLFRESESPANKASAKIGGAAIGGAIIGAIVGGGKGAAIGSGIGAAGGTAAAMSSDRMRVVVPAGTTVSVRTQAPITVTVEK
jgi:hypothetical protein